MESVCRQRPRVTPEKRRQCPGEGSRMETKKWRPSADDVSRVAKNFVSVLGKLPGRQPKMADLCRRIVECGTHNVPQNSREL
jgi:hypothetical protein